MIHHSFFQFQTLPDFDRKSYHELRKAIRIKDEDLVRHLITQGANINGIRQDSIELPPLHLAVMSRCPKMIRLLLDSGADMSVKCLMRGDTPLTLAARIEDTALIDLLLSHNVCNGVGWNGLTHLHIACMRNKLEVVRILLQMDQGGNINKAVDKESLYWAGYTALHFAVRYACTETVELLLKCGAYLEAMDSKEMTPLQVADLHCREEIIDLLLSIYKQEHETLGNPGDFSPFLIACSRDNVTIVEHFLNLGMNIEDSCWRRWGPLSLALYYECPNVLALLKNRVNLRDDYCSEIIEYAIHVGDEKLRDFFRTVEMNSTKQLENYEKSSQYHTACIEDDVETIEELISDGTISVPSDINSPLWTNSTPLHLAVTYKAENAVEFLLKCGADMTIEDACGKTPFHLAFDKGFVHVIDEIAKKLGSCPVNLVDNEGVTFFHIVCTSNRLEMVKNFVSVGVNVNSRVRDQSVLWSGFTPLHFAVKFYKPNIVGLLLKSGADISITNKLAQNPFDLLVHDMITHDHGESIGRRYLTLICDILLEIFSSEAYKKKTIDYRGISPLHALCILPDGDRAKLEQYLITHGKEINQTIDLPRARKFHKCTPLHLTMQRDDYRKTTLLIENGADFSIVNGVGQNPIHCAMEVGYLTWNEVQCKELQIVFNSRLLIEKSHPSHFYFACAVGLVKCVRDFLNKITDNDVKMSYINCRNDAGQTSLHSLLLVVTGKCPEKREIMQMLLNNGLDVNSKDYKLETLLHSAQEACDPVFTNTLLKHGADVNAQNLYGQTPLHHAVHVTHQWGRRDKIITLLRNGADVDVIDQSGTTCVLLDKRSFESCEDDYQDTAKILLKHVKKLQVLGYPVSPMNRFAYSRLFRNSNQTFNEAAFVAKCENELASMTTVSIDHNTTLHAILFRSLKAMTLLYKSTDLRKIVESDDFSKKYPIYGYLIELQIKNGRVRHTLLEKSMQSFISLLDRRLPQDCLEIILQYLSNADLNNICLST